ncbi:MAG: glycosyltransferase family 2 protein [Planctomycetota bacterium]|jgi:GT2 family glycosyltransferase
MQVSIVILNWNHPHNISRLLPSLQKTSGVTYETVVVDNGSTADVVGLLKDYQSQGLIDRLVLEPVNHYFSEGNNIGVRHSDPASEFVLLFSGVTGWNA